MSLSFEDSLNNSVVMPVQEEPEVEEQVLSVAAYSMRSAASINTDGWTKVTNKGYRFYGNEYGDEYDDEKYSTIDELKNITVDPSQINITQEQNSQYIPFKMPRYYDGFDLKNTEISVFYVNKDNNFHVDIPVDVYYNDEYIRFAWLVSSFATQVAGVLKFEIHAKGQNSKNETYVWKSKTYDKLNVVQSLEVVADGEIGLSEEEVTSWYNKIQIESSSAQAAAKSARESADEALRLVNSLRDGITSEVETAVDARVETVVNEKISDQLVDYYKKSETYSQSEVDTLINEVKPVGYATEVFVKELVGDPGKDENGSERSVIEYVDHSIESLDLTNKLGNYYTKDETFSQEEVQVIIGDTGVNEDGSKKSVTDYISDMIESQDITGKLGDYYKKSETYSRDEIADLLDEVKPTGYATEDFVNNKVAVAQSKADQNEESIGLLTSVVNTLQSTVDGIDKSERVTYDASYGKVEAPDGTETDNVFTLWEIPGGDEERKTVKVQFPITGGGGGGNVSSVTMITKFYPDSSARNVVAIAGDQVVLQYSFSGKDAADEDIDCVATWYVGSRVVATETISTGEPLSFNATKYLSPGTNTIKMIASNGASSSSPKTWTVEVIEVSVTSNFNDSLYYDYSPLTVNCVPNGATNKTVHFVLDGEEVYTAQTSYSNTSLNPPCQIEITEHGSHLMEIYVTAEINGKTHGIEEVVDEETGEVIRTVHTIQVLKDIMWYDPSVGTPLIGCTYQNFYAQQYDTTEIEFYVYDFTTSRPTVTIAVDGEVVSTKTLDGNFDSYPYRADTPGEHIITITCGETVKTLTANIEALDINVAPITADLAFDFSPIGRSNNSTDRLWTDDTVSMTVSPNFDWVNGGYQIDEEKNSCFVVKAGTWASFDYKLFGDDAKTFGKEFKLIFKTMNVSYANATFLECLDNTTATNHIGLQMNVHEAIVYAATGSLNLPYSETDIIEFEFNISPSTEEIPMVLGYEDGVATRPMVYGLSHSFKQSTARDIYIGSDYCDVYIYRMKAYKVARSDNDILQNFIADARTAPDMIDRFKRNQIYEGGVLNPDYLAKMCPHLRVFKVSAPYFTNKKDDKVNNTTIECIYKDGDPTLDNWVAYNSVHSGQGTTSDNYGAAGRNLDFIMKPYKDYGNDAYIQLGDGSIVQKISLTRNSVPVDYLNVKVNIASSNNMTNALLAKRYNQYNPYERPFVRSIPLESRYTAEEIAKMSVEERAKAVAALEAEAQKEIAKIRDTMEFYNCVVFIQETNEDVSTHREFADTAWHFYAIGNVGDSKKTDDTRLTDMDDPYECCIEIMDIERPLSDFPVNTMMNAMGSVEDKETGEITYTWAKDENLGILHELIDGKYVLTQDTTVDLSKTYYVDILEHDDFSENYTYGWRYISDDEDQDVVNYCHQKWIEFYRFVTTSTDEKFKEDLGKYAVLDSVLYYYLFTARYCMVDNRAKNSFWHYGKTGEVDSEGNPIRKWDLSWDYDNDTSLGLDNYGRMVYRYGLEDTDVDENGKEVFREMDSTFFCRVRDLFPGELKALYNTLDYAWNANSLINEADEWQAQFPEELWRLDIQRKYIRPYHADDQFLKNMMNGRMKYHRRQWERGQEQYMASKYQSSTASSDNNSVNIRVSNPTDYVVKPYYGLTITPYDYVYVNVRYGSTSTPIQVKGEPGVPVVIDYQGGTSEIKIFSASSLQSIGDLSACYPITVGAGPATRLNELIIGNDTSAEVNGVTKTYDNPFFTTLTLGANELLEILNIENISSLNQELDLRQLKSLRELYAKGTSVQGVIFADRGNVEIAELPAISYLEMHNLMSLKTLDIESLDNLETLIVESCDTVDVLSILNSAPNLSKVQLIGVNWRLDSDDLLERIYAMPNSILDGNVHVPLMYERNLDLFKAVWPDLSISYDSLSPSHLVTFMNADGVIVNEQYVDDGGYAVPPSNPTLESSVMYDYTFSKWTPEALGPIYQPVTYTAVYTESLRQYSIRYESMGKVLYSASGPYGSNISYPSDYPIPTYDKEEPKTFYLFDGWDKSGFLNGDFNEEGVRVVNANFTTYTYTGSIGTDLSEMTLAEIYAMNKLGLAKSALGDVGDQFSFVIGNDFTYSDIDDEVLVDRKMSFDGSSSIYDTGVKLFDQPKDFVLAIDYELMTGNSTGAVLAQCMQGHQDNGFKLAYSTGTFDGVKLMYGDKESNIVGAGRREMIVMRYKADSKTFTFYKSALDSDEIGVETLSPSFDIPAHNHTLVFGAQKLNDNTVLNHAACNIYWAKVWWADLGEEDCRNLALWTHESMSMTVCSFGEYSLAGQTSDNTCSFTMLANHLLGRTKRWNNAGGNTGGWASSDLNKSLNKRLYQAIPTQIKALMKEVVVRSSIGDGSTTCSESNCYISIPAIIELDNDSAKKILPYTRECVATIPYMKGSADRLRAFDGGEANAYWTRSPNAANQNSWVFTVQDTGLVYGNRSSNSSLGVLIQISF